MNAILHPAGRKPFQLLAGCASLGFEQLCAFLSSLYPMTKDGEWLLTQLCPQLHKVFSKHIQLSGYTHQKEKEIQGQMGKDSIQG